MLLILVKEMKILKKKYNIDNNFANNLNQYK